MTVLNSMLWGNESEKAPPKSSPTSPASPLSYWVNYADYYGWRAHTALDSICAIPAPEGVIVWLGDHAMYLYQRLTSALPDRISRAWNARIAHEDFNALCDELVDTYRRAVDLYVAAAGKVQR